MNETIKKYLSDHWIAMLFSMAGSTAVFIIALINIYVNFRLDYAALKESVDANTKSQSVLLKVHEEILNSVIETKQKEEDDHVLLEDLHVYILGTKNSLTK